MPLPLGAVPFTPPDLPNPRVRKAPSQPWDDQLRQLAIKEPTRQTDWPNPAPRKPHAWIHTFTGSLLALGLLVSVPPAPFAQTVQANPAVRKANVQTDQVSANTRLLSGAPVVQEDWPNPRVRPPPAPPDVVQNNLLNQRSAWPFHNEDWPNPRLRVPPTPAWEDSLRQLTIPAPFAQGDWVTPPAKRHAQPDVVENNTLYQVPPPVAGFPFVQEDWVTPPPKRYAQPDVVQNNLLNQRSAWPFHNEDQPNPVLKKPPVQSWDDSLRQLTIPAPFYQTEWPVSPPKRYAQPDVVENNTLLQVPPPIAGFPFSQEDWPNPVPRKAPSQPWEDGLRQLTIPAPFYQEDWPNPVVRRAAQPDVVENNTLLQVPPPIAGFPFQQTNWANPVVRRAAQPDVVENNTLLQAPPAPFQQTQWPNPVPRKAPSQPWEDGLRQLNLAAPFVQEDWVTPPAKRHAQPDVVQNTLLRLVAPVVVVLPFGQEDWQNPQRRNVSQQESIQNTLVYKAVVPAVLPFRQLDWQNPTLRKVAQQPAPYQRGLVDITVRVTGVTGFGTIGTVTVVIVNLWNPVDDNQGSVWGAVPDAQTPSWTPVVDGQVGSWSPVSDTQTPSWASVDDSQTTSWTSVNDSQTPAWGTINDGQIPNWVPVNDAQTPAWSAVADTQIVVWTNVNDTQVNAWTPVDDSQNDDWTPVPP